MLNRCKFHLWQAAIALDQLVNAVCGGWADETLSSRAYRCGRLNKGWRVAETCINAVFFWDKDEYDGVMVRHCELSYISEVQRLQSPPSTRQSS